MTVTDLVVNFRSGLLGLLPAVERVEMPWRPSDAYDEWDDLAQAVYEALVVWPLRWTLPEDMHESFSMPRYNLLLATYAGLSLVEVMTPKSRGAIQVFHALGTTDVPFDTVEWRPVGPTGSPLSDALESMPLDGARFAMRVCANSSSAQVVEEIAVPSRRS
jgi:hypothetical protein